MTIVRLLCAGLLTGALLAPPLPAAAQQLQLESVVLLSRHGVRSPTEPLDELDKRVASPWARWPVAPGELTPRGAELMTLMGGYYHALYAGRGLLPAADCPAAGTVAAWADIDQRTRLTAQSILDGLYPRCGLKERHQVDLSRPDSLFHPPKSGGACPVDPERAKAAVLERIGGNFTSVLKEYAAPLAAMQAILCPPELSAGKVACGLEAAPAELETRRSGGIVMKGPIAIGSTAVEIFLLESAQGMPHEQVAWGRLKGDATLHDLLVVRALQFDLMERTLYLARQQGSNLLATILTTIEDRRSFPAAAASPDGPRFVLLVGHDTNVTNMAGLLGIGWAIQGFQPNEASPGGALAFEVLRDPASGRRYVELAYYAQTLDQMRQVTKLDLDHPAGVSKIDLPACGREARGRACPLERFVEIARAAIDPGCLTLQRN
ncbi:MAG: histidine-type phosphatase [Reyranellales bacterium]